MSHYLILPIKKVYFDQILSKEKTKEYRANTPFYQRRLNKKYKSIVLHYYKGSYLIAKIKSIELVPNPLLHENLSFLSTPEVFEISLSSPKRFILNGKT
jgi:hypothetical protein